MVLQRDGAAPAAGDGRGGRAGRQGLSGGGARLMRQKKNDLMEEWRRRDKSNKNGTGGFRPMEGSILVRVRQSYKEETFSESRYAKVSYERQGGEADDLQWSTKDVKVSLT